MPHQRTQEVIQVAERWDPVPANRLTEVFFREKGHLYYTTSKILLQGNPNIEMPIFDINSTDVFPIPPAVLYTDWFDGITRYNEGNYLPMNVYIKTPSLAGRYDPSDPQGLACRVQPEVKILEEIKAVSIIERPHDNIEEYYGCTQSPDGHFITGICIKKYARTLEEICYAKERREQLADSAQGKDLLATKLTDVAGYTLPTTPERVIEGVIKGLQYLHGLGIIHCDIKPSNIMFEEDGRPIIIDFDSAVKKGEQRVGPGTFQWSDDLQFSSIAIEDLDIRGVYRVIRFLHKYFTLDGMDLPRRYGFDSVIDDFPAIKKWLTEKIDCAHPWIIMKEDSNDVVGPL